MFSNHKSIQKWINKFHIISIYVNLEQKGHHMEASQADDNCSTKEKKLEEQTQVYCHFS